MNVGRNQKEIESNMANTEITARDGAMPSRLLPERKWKPYIAEHNPYAAYPDSVEGINYYLWAAQFYMDQASAIWDPKRSRRAWVMKFVLIPLYALVLAGTAVGVVLRLAGVLK